MVIEASLVDLPDQTVAWVDSLSPLRPAAIVDFSAFVGESGLNESGIDDGSRHTCTTAAYDWFRWIYSLRLEEGLKI